MIIIIDEPNEDLGGGALCAPIAAQIIEEAMPILGIEPKYDDSESENLSSYAPNVTGMSLEKAEETINDYSLNYMVIGEGDKVVRQSPTSAVTIPNNGTVYIYLGDNVKQTVKVPDFTGLTVSEAKSLANDIGLNIEVTGKDLSSGNVVASRQSEDAEKEVEIGAVITVTFNNTESVLD